MASEHIIQILLKAENSTKKAVAEAIADLELLRAKVKEVGLTKADIEVKVSGAEKVEAKKKELGKNVKVKVELDADTAQAKMDKLIGELATESRKRHKLTTDVETGASERKIQRIRDQLRDLGFDKRKSRKLVVEIDKQHFDADAKKVQTEKQKLEKSIKANFGIDFSKAKREAVEINRIKDQLAKEKTATIRVKLDEAEKARVRSGLDDLAKKADDLSRKNVNIKGLINRKEFDAQALDLRRQLYKLAGIKVDPKVTLDKKRFNAERLIVEEKLRALGAKREHVSVILDFKDRGILDRLREMDHELEKTNRSGRTLATSLVQGLLVGLLTFLPQVVSALTALVGGFIAVAAAATEAAGAVAGFAAAGAAQAIPVVGLLVAAFKGLGNVNTALKAQETDRKQSAPGQVSADKSRTTAAHTLRSAHEGVTNALKGVKDAQDRVSKSHRDLADAQRKLTAARHDGVRQLQDLVTAEQEAELAAKRSSLAYTTSKYDLAKDIGSGSGLVQSDQLDVQEAALTKKTSRRDLQRQRQDTGTAVAGGVNSLPDVKSAVQGVEDAKKSVEDANQALADARQQVADAEGAVSDAAGGIADATDKISSSQSALAFALAKLSPAERKLFTTIERLKKEFGGPHGIVKSLTDPITLGLVTSLNHGARVLRDNTLVTALRRLSGEIGTQMGQLAGFLSGPRIRRAFSFFSDEATANLPQVERILEHLIGIFTSVGRAASGIFARGLADVNGYLTDLDSRAASFGGQNRLATFFDHAYDALASFMRLGASFGHLLGAIIGASYKQGISGVDGLSAAFDRATGYVNTHTEKVRSFFSAAVKGSGDVLNVLFQISKAFVHSFNEKELKTFSQFFIDVLIPVFNTVLRVIQVISKVLIEAFNAPFIGHFLKVFIGVSVAGSLLAKTFKTVAGAALSTAKNIGTAMESANGLAARMGLVAKSTSEAALAARELTAASTGALGAGEAKAGAAAAGATAAKGGLGAGGGIAAGGLLARGAGFARGLLPKVLRGGGLAFGGAIAGSVAKSVIPGQAGKTAGGALTGAGAGAGIGTLIAPGVGTAIGAALGAAAGGIISTLKGSKVKKERERVRAAAEKFGEDQARTTSAAIRAGVNVPLAQKIGRTHAVESTRTNALGGAREKLRQQLAQRSNAEIGLHNAPTGSHQADVFEKQLKFLNQRIPETRKKIKELGDAAGKSATQQGKNLGRGTANQLGASKYIDTTQAIRTFRAGTVPGESKANARARALPTLDLLTRGLKKGQVDKEQYVRYAKEISSAFGRNLDSKKAVDKFIHDASVRLKNQKLVGTVKTLGSQINRVFGDSFDTKKLGHSVQESARATFAAYAHLTSKLKSSDANQRRDAREQLKKLKPVYDRELQALNHSTDPKVKKFGRNLQRATNHVKALRREGKPIRVKVDAEGNIFKRIPQLLRHLRYLRNFNKLAAKIPLKLFHNVFSPGAATGARIGGNPADGDSVGVRVKPGEVILNRTQQSLLGHAQVNEALDRTGAPTIVRHGGAYASGGGRARQTSLGASSPAKAPSDKHDTTSGIDLDDQVKFWGKLVKIIASAVNRIEDRVDLSRTRIARSFKKITSDSKDRLQQFNSDGNKYSNHFADNIADAMGDASKSTHDAISYIVSTTNKGLKSFDAKPVKVSFDSPPGKKGKKKAATGYIGLPGERGADNEHIIVGRGEAILNAPQQRYVNESLQRDRGHGLGGVFKRVHGEHGDSREGGFAKGGFAKGGYPGALGEVHAGVRNATLAILKRFPKLRAPNHGGTTGGNHVPNSDHYKGIAVDIGGDIPTMIPASTWIKRNIGKQLKQGIHNPNLAINLGKPVNGPSFYSAVWEGHKDHIHIAIAGALGKFADMGGFGKPTVKRGKVKGKGALHDLVDAGSEKARKIANKLLSKKYDQSSAGSEPTSGGGKDSAGGQYDKGRLKALWIKAGGPKAVANTAAAIALAESGGNPNAGASHPYHGLWQVGPGGSFDPFTNAKEAVGKYHGAGNKFTPWATYTGADTGPGGGHGPKTYLQYLRSGGYAGRGLRGYAKGGGTKVGFTTYNDSPPGAYGDGLSNGYAELGTATSGGHGTGHGWLAKALGRKGELPENFPLSVTIHGKTKTLKKRDRGYGQGGNGSRSNPAYALDVWRDSWKDFGIGATSSGKAVIDGGSGSDSKETKEPKKKRLRDYVEHFDVGGVVPGGEGQARPIIAHGQEWILNSSQRRAAAGLAGLSESELADELDFSGTSAYRKPKRKKGIPKALRIDSVHDAEHLSQRTLGGSDALAAIIKRIPKSVGKKLRSRILKIVKNRLTEFYKKLADRIEAQTFGLLALPIRSNDDPTVAARLLKQLSTSFTKFSRGRKRTQEAIAHQLDLITQDGQIFANVTEKIEAATAAAARRIQKTIYRVSKIGRRFVGDRRGSVSADAGLGAQLKASNDQAAQEIADLGEARGDTLIERHGVHDLKSTALKTFRSLDRTNYSKEFRRAKDLKKQAKRVGVKLTGRKSDRASVINATRQSEAEDIAAGTAADEYDKQIVKLERKRKHAGAKRKKRYEKQIDRLKSKSKSAGANKGVAQNLEKAVNALIKTQDDLDQTLADNAQAIVERQEKAEQDALGLTNASFDRRNKILTNATTNEASYGSGIGALTPAIIGAQIKSSQDQVKSLLGQRAFAIAHGNNDLADTIKDQIDDLNQAIIQGVSDQFQAVTDTVNNLFSAYSGLSQNQVTLAQAGAPIGIGAGGVGVNSGRLGRPDFGTLGQTYKNDESAARFQQTALKGQLVDAFSKGLYGKVLDLIKQISDLDVTITQSIQAQRANTLAMVQSEFTQRTASSDFLGGLAQAGGQLAATNSEISGNSTLDAQRGYLGQQQSAIGDTIQAGKDAVTDLISKLGLGDISGGIQGSTGNDLLTTIKTLYQTLAGDNKSGLLSDDELAAFRDLFNSLVSNTQAQADSTLALKNLTDTMTQAFTSSAWTTFRQAIFDGSGGLLAPYQAAMQPPAMATGGIITKSGAFQLHAGEKVTPSSMADKGASIENFNLNVTNPTEILDTNLIAQKFAWTIASSGRQ